MTTQEIIDYYAKLLILQYRQKPRAFATIQALVTPVIMDQVPDAVQNAYAIPTAEGVQLDVIGKYVGVVRNGFSFTGAITLSDDDFRTLINIKIIQNNFGSSLATIQDLLHQFFPGQILVFDFKNMQMSYMIDSLFGSLDLVEMIILQNLLPKPMAVQLASVIYSPNIFSFFGFRTYDNPGFNVSPFNNYNVYTLTWPFLSYSDALMI